MSQALSRESPGDKHHAIIFPWLSPQQPHPTAGLAASPPVLFASSWLQTAVAGRGSVDGASLSILPKFKPLFLSFQAHCVSHLE